MKHYLTAAMFCAYFLGFSQNDIKTSGVYYKISLAGTVTTNEEYTFDSEDDTGPFFLPNGLFINNSLGYQFDKRSSIDINAEYDHYFVQGYNFLPICLGFNYTIFDFDDVIFVRGGYGRLVNLGKDFETGTMYKFGIGYRGFFDETFRNSVLIGLDFNRKRFGFRQEEKLSGVSIFLEFMFF